MVVAQTKKIANTRAKRPSRGRNKGKEKESNDLEAGNQDVAINDAAAQGNMHMANEEGNAATDGEVARMHGE